MRRTVKRYVEDPLAEEILPRERFHEGATTIRHAEGRRTGLPRIQREIHEGAEEN
ncbi:MAG: hypothetical protein IPK53_20645, partial [bacterium]|nr:hypothetical protein [bacterium]